MGTAFRSAVTCLSCVCVSPRRKTFPRYRSSFLPPCVDCKRAYSERQREGAIGSVFGVDTQLIRDGTYYVVEAPTGEGKRGMAGCGGANAKRFTAVTRFLGRTTHGSIRRPTRCASGHSLFTHPDWPRRGVGSRILEVCEAAARAAGFTRLEMAATLPGVALYKARGYVEVEPFDVPLSNGEKLPVLG